MAALPALPFSLLPSLPVLSRTSHRKPLRVVSNLNHLSDIVRNDFEFLKKGIGKGVNWANRTFRIPQLTSAIDDVVWLRNLEDPHAPPLQPPPWPQPSYPELSGVDLMMADMKALEAYGAYLYYMCRAWSKPLPEVYDPQDVAHYFNCRPHLVAFRLIEIFSAFAAATVKIRTVDMRENFRSDSRKNMDGNVSRYNFGMVLKETMLNLGPTFIKGQCSLIESQDYQHASYMPLLTDAVGQSLSTRPDIIGAEMSKALSELHDQIPPFPRETAMKIIEEELGSPIHSVFSHISEEPVAAASFGQVYSAKTLDGHSIAVKVQRPNLRHVVVRDIYILRLGLGVLQRVAKRKNDLRLYADELGKGLVGELDYTLEAANASMFLEAHSPFPFICVPKVYHNLTRKRVLTMEWVVGESPTDLLTVSTGNAVDHGSVYPEKKKLEAKKNLLDLVSKGVEASLIQLLETGLLHADPHPGNLRYTSSGQIGFLDFGLLCQMEKKHQFAMLASIVHIVNGDWESLVRSLIEMDVVRPGTNIRRVTMELEDSLEEVKFRDGIPDVKFSRVLGKIWSVALKYHFRMPPYYTLVLRSLASLEGLAVAADPNFKTFEAAYPYVVRKLLTENSGETRKIFFSVVLNKKKEFRWERLALFLRVGSTRKVLSSVIASKSGSSLDYLPDRSNDIFDIALLILRILPSKDGVVIRKLLMAANGASLVRAFISKEAMLFRRQICRLIADVLYQWMIQTLGFGQGMMAAQYSSQAQLISRPHNVDLGASSRASLCIYDYQSILTDRRLKVIFTRILDSARKEPVLMLKFYWTSFAMLVMASALAFHHFLVSMCNAYISNLLPSPKRVATGV